MWKLWNYTAIFAWYLVVLITIRWNGGHTTFEWNGSNPVMMKYHANSIQCLLITYYVKFIVMEKTWGVLCSLVMKKHFFFNLDCWVFCLIYNICVIILHIMIPTWHCESPCHTFSVVNWITISWKCCLLTFIRISPESKYRICFNYICH